MTLENLFVKLAAPARRAIEAHGITDISELAACSPEQIASWHGIGKNAMKIITDFLKGYNTNT